VRGKVDRRGESLQIVCESISEDLPRETPMEAPCESVRIRLELTDDEWSDIRAMQTTDQILQHHEGHVPVEFELVLNARITRVLRSRTRRVDWSEHLQTDLLAVAGITSAELTERTAVLLAS
jgi:hypothetical protein